MQKTAEITTTFPGEILFHFKLIINMKLEIMTGLYWKHKVHVMLKLLVKFVKRQT